MQIKYANPKKIGYFYFYKWINARGLIFSLKAEGIQKHA